jgi:outer membrane protein assembly factor BamB
MRRHALLAAVLLLCGTTVPNLHAADPAVFPGESRTTAAKLAEVRKKIDRSEYTAAVDDLLAVLDSGGNDLVPVTPQHSLPARWLCHREIAKLPPEALREYRSRVDAQAKKWLDAGAAARDAKLLRRVADEAFCTRAGEAAVDLLGDIAFERGRFDEAVAWWRLLAPPLDAKKEKRDELALAYPDVQGDKARLYAKQIVARFFAGDTEAAARELTAFRKEYPKAEGTFAGRKGIYADLLQDVTKEPPPETARAWTTFGGDATRGEVVSAPPRWIDRLNRTVKDGPTWQFSLETRKPLEEVLPVGKEDAPSVQSRRMAFHPLICGNYVVVADARFVTAYDLRTGKATDWYDVTADRINALAPPDLKLPTKKLDLRYTLTAADGCLYARLGAQELFRADEERGKKDEDRAASFLACLSLDPAAKERLRWCIPPIVVRDKPVLAQRGAIFEGAPLVHDGSLYVAVTWFEGDRTLTGIQCYPAGTTTAPAWRWQQTVCETREVRGKETRARHHLLTVAGPNVVYCSHSGAVVAVDALTGKTAWAVRYPSKTPTNADEPSLRDLAPCLYAAERLYVAPADFDRLMCLNPATGETLWQRDRISPTHLLGVGHARLIFTTLTELRAVDAKDGSDVWRLPDGGGKLAPVGRGVLIGDVVVWPTAKGVFVRRQEDGDPIYSTAILDRVPVGNLVYADGVLAVADRTTLSVFVPREKESKDVGKAEAREPAAPSKGARGGSAASRPPDREQARPADLPLQRSASLPLEPGERALLSADEDLLTARPDGTFRLRSPATAQVRWMCKLVFAAVWAERQGKVIVAGGDGGVAALLAETGERVWDIHATDGRFSGFQLAADTVAFLRDEEQLVAVDTATGNVRWTKWAVGAKLNQPPPLGHFHPQLRLIGSALLVQPTPGRLWLLDAATGKVLHEESHRYEPWPRPPLPVDENTVAVVLDARTVGLFDGDKRKFLWKHVNTDATTPSGEAPQLAVGDGNILLLTANNIGYRLQRLDRATGKPKWDKPPLLETKTRPDTAGWSLDKDAVYYAQDQVLTARSVREGKILWQQALPEASGGWRTGRVGEAVLANPGGAGAEGIRFRWLCFSVQCQVDHSPALGTEPGLPVVCCDAKSGRLMQRLNLVAGPPRVRTRLGFLSRFATQPDFETVVMNDAVPRIVTSRAGVTIALDSHVWRYCPARNP